MRICYFMDSVDPGGGVRVVFDQARALVCRGHKVKIRTLGGNPGWYPYPVSVDHVERLDQKFENKDMPDAVIATFWNTVGPAVATGVSMVFHLCQGFEADLPELVKDHSAILAAYRQPIPKLVIGPWLAERLKAVFSDSLFSIHCIGQCVDSRMYQPAGISLKPWLPKGVRGRFPWQILVVGDYAISCKGICDALHAVALIRNKLPRVYLSRVSMHPPDKAENLITRINSSYVRLSPKEMISVYHKSDFMISMSFPAEGFGLPAAEAMASGCPVVLTRIPSYLGFDRRQNYASFVDVGDNKASAAAILDLIDNPWRCFRQRQRALQVVRNNFQANNVAANIEQIIQKQVP